MTARLIDPTFRALDGNGNPISGACLYIYEAGGSTPINTYSDSGLMSANSNPVESGATGLFPDMFVSADDYKVIFTDGSGGLPRNPINDVTLDTWDNIEISSSPTLTITETINAQTGTSYTIQTTDRTKLITLSNASPIAITLPQAEATDFPAGWYVTISNKGAGTATITPATSTLDGLASYTMRTGEQIKITSDGTNYQISMIGGKNPGVNAQTGATYTILTGDREKLVTFSNTATIAVVLAQANTTTFKNGWTTEVENIGAGIVTITPTTSTINGGEATLVLTRGQRAKITSDGTNYQSVTYGAPVGDIIMGYSATAPQGRLVETGVQTVGSATSGATFAAAKYQALYHHYWNNIADANAAVSTGRGATAIADFAANKTLTIPNNANRSPYGVGTAATGAASGATTAASTGTIGTSGATTLSTPQIPSHTHTMNNDQTTAGTPDFVASAGGSATARTSSATGGGGSHTHTGGTYTGDATSILHPIRGMYFYIKY